MHRTAQRPPVQRPPAHKAVLPVAVLFGAAVLSMASARAQDAPEDEEWAQDAPEHREWAQHAVPDHALGAAAWPGLPADEQAMVDAVAREVWAETGAARLRYDSLPEPRKAALRGTAMRRLGLRPSDLSKGWV